MIQTWSLLIQTGLPYADTYLSEHKSHLNTNKCVCDSVCFTAINVTRARFSGNDEFGYTSFVAYSSLPSLSFFYEFQLQFTLANNSSAVKDNLLVFAGHKGQGEIRSWVQHSNLSSCLRSKEKMKMSPQLLFFCFVLFFSLGHAVAISSAVYSNGLSDRIQSPLRSSTEENSFRRILFRGRF